MYTLYAMYGSCSMAVHVILNELAQDVTLINVNDAANKDSFQVHAPLGQVPALVDGNLTITEGAAIIQYLLEKHDNNTLWPKQGAARAKALQWLAFANATMHPAYGRCFFIKSNIADAAQQQQLLQTAVAQINKLWQYVEQQLNTTAYVAGDQLTAADILLSVIANWADYISSDIVLGAKTKQLFAKIAARPGFQKALSTENVTYKAAA